MAADRDVHPSCCAQVRWSKTRRSFFFILTVAVFLINVALVLYYSAYLGNHTLPKVYTYIFLGWNFHYNIQVRVWVTAAALRGLRCSTRLALLVHLRVCGGGVPRSGARDLCSWPTRRC